MFGLLVKNAESLQTLLNQQIYGKWDQKRKEKTKKESTHKQDWEQQQQKKKPITEDLSKRDKNNKWILCSTLWQ